MGDFVTTQVKDWVDIAAAAFSAMSDGDKTWDDFLEELIQWGKHSNAPFRDARKVYENYIK